MAQSLAARPTPILEGQGISLWVLSFNPSGKGGPTLRYATLRYATAGVAFRVIAPRKPPYPAIMPSSRWRYLEEDVIVYIIINL